MLEIETDITRRMAASLDVIIVPKEWLRVRIAERARPCQGSSNLASKSLTFTKYSACETLIVFKHTTCPLYVPL